MQRVRPSAESLFLHGLREGLLPCPCRAAPTGSLLSPGDDRRRSSAVQTKHSPLHRAIARTSAGQADRRVGVSSDGEDPADRQEVRTVLVHFASKAMKTLTDDLTHAQQEENFSERDLRQWMDTLTKIKKELDKPPTIQIRKGPGEPPLITRLSVNVCEIFEQCAGKLVVKDEGRLIVNGGINAYGTVRSQGEYSVGRHRLRLKIEHTGRKKWNIIGIVSKSVAIQSAAFSTLTSFGWLANNSVCVNGKVSSDAQGYQSDLDRNDIIELIVDCHEQKIRWTNERTRNTHELTIDPKLCPFPWQVHVGLYYAKDRIRLLWKWLSTFLSQASLTGREKRVFAVREGWSIFPSCLDRSDSDQWLIRSLVRSRCITQLSSIILRRAMCLIEGDSARSLGGHGLPPAGQRRHASRTTLTKRTFNEGDDQRLLIDHYQSQSLIGKSLSFSCVSLSLCLEKICMRCL